jgi:PadR family transcriptional regulator AphA
MNLHATILALLEQQPASGYDLKRIISDSDVYYWSGNNNQIYKTLLELQQGGLVNVQIQQQESLPSKKVYSITASGQSSLRQNLMESPELPELHKAFLIQLASATTLSDLQILNLLEQYESEISTQLRIYQEQTNRAEEDSRQSRRAQYLWRSVMINLIAAYLTELDWVRQLQRDLREGNLPR